MPVTLDTARLQVTGKLTKREPQWIRKCSASEPKREVQVTRCRTVLTSEDHRLLRCMKKEPVCQAVMKQCRNRACPSV